MEHQGAQSVEPQRRGGIRSLLTRGRVHALMMVGCVAAMGAGMWFLSGGRGSGPWMLFILVCPLMHLLMGHGLHRSGHDAKNHGEANNPGHVHKDGGGTE